MKSDVIDELEHIEHHESHTCASKERQERPHRPNDIKIIGLPPQMTLAELRQFLQPFGPHKRLTMHRTRPQHGCWAGKVVGSAFIEYSSPDAASNAAIRVRQCKIGRNNVSTGPLIDEPLVVEVNPLAPARPRRCRARARPAPAPAPAPLALPASPPSSPPLVAPAPNEPPTPGFVFAAALEYGKFYYTDVVATRLGYGEEQAGEVIRRVASEIAMRDFASTTDLGTLLSSPDFFLAKVDATVASGNNPVN